MVALKGAKRRVKAAGGAKRGKATTRGKKDAAEKKNLAEGPPKAKKPRVKSPTAAYQDAVAKAKRIGDLLHERVGLKTQLKEINKEINSLDSSLRDDLLETAQGQGRLDFPDGSANGNGSGHGATNGHASSVRTPRADATRTAEEGIPTPAPTADAGASRVPASATPV